MLETRLKRHHVCELWVMLNFIVRFLHLPCMFYHIYTHSIYIPKFTFTLILITKIVFPALAPAPSSAAGSRWAWWTGSRAGRARRRAAASACSSAGSWRPPRPRCPRSRAGSACRRSPDSEPALNYWLDMYWYWCWVICIFYSLTAYSDGIKLKIYVLCH